MKTLVIHPKDKTTDFLKPIYNNIECTIINDCNIYPNDLVQHIKDHDRIIMMGHGSPSGLFNIDGGYGLFIISSIHVYLLKEKYCVGVWCNADQFFNKHKLKGIYTGMVISEQMEALIFNKSLDINKIKYSNDLLAQTFKDNIDGMDGSNNELIIENILHNYDSHDNDIIDFNRQRIYSR